MSITQDLHHEIETLPPESLADLADYIAFLRFKRKQSIDLPSTSITNDEYPLRIIKLRGILSGYDFSPELLQEARREMWQKFQVEES